MINIYNWNKKAGECVIHQHDREFTLNLYASGTCNCFLTAVYEYTDPATDKITEQLQWFFVDEDHGKRMLGIKKTATGQKENVFEGEIKKITLFKKNCKDYKKIVAMFAEAFDNIEIVLKGDDGCSQD